MMMGGMGMDMMNMGMPDMSSASGSMNMSAGMNGGMGYMQGMGNMQGMTNMPGMATPEAMQGMMNYPNAANGMGNMTGMNGMGNMPGMTDPNAMAGMTNQAGGTGGILGFSNLDFNTLLTGLLHLAIDIFAVLLIIGLIVGVVVLIKRYVFDGDLLTTNNKVVCTKCGQTLKNDWACCPKCGESRPVPTQSVAPNPQTA